MASINQVATIIPEHEMTIEGMSEVGRRWLSGDEVAQEKFLRISNQSGVKTRRFNLPYDQVLGLNGLQFRANQFEEVGIQMLVQGIEKALEDSHTDPLDVGALVFTSCSVPVIPSIDAAAILQSRLATDVSRVPIFQHGCAGGVIGLHLGAKLSRLGKPVVVSSVELCSLVFQPENHSGAHLVGAAIFADGAAATVISPDDDGVRFIDSRSVLLPNTRHLMGYDIFDDGFHLRLDRALPSKLVKEAPTIASEFLSANGLSSEQVNYWLFHPGGIKILEFLRETFNLEREQCHWSYDVLRDNGNLSSATILYVLQSFLDDKVLQPGEYAVVMGIGPGLTIEMILIQG